jgi:glycosyltransferase involved in cell wall biosynthesis
MQSLAHPHIVVDHLPLAKSSLRVAFVTETYPPEVNGVSLTVARLVEGLQQRQHQVQLIRPRQTAIALADAPPQPHEVLMRGLPIPRYPNLRMGLPARRALVRLWSVHRPDVVHIATEGPLGWSALQAALHLRLPVCSDFRTNFHAYSQHYGVGWLRRPIMAYLRKFHNQTQCTMVPTEDLRQSLVLAGFHNVQVVSRGVDVERFHPRHRSDDLRAGWAVSPDELVVACVGRLAAEKNLELLLTAFEAIGRAGIKARLLLVGDGPMREALRHRCPQAVLAGQRTGADLAAHYASADLFVFPSLTETFGNVTAEAMASGLPVLAFDYAAAAQLIDSGVNGVLAPLADETAFVREAVRLAGDRAQRASLGARARETACQIGWDSVVSRFVGVLSAVSRRTPAASVSDGELASARTV